ASLRLVVLNACEGGRSGAEDPFAGTAQSLAQQGIPAVIAMQRPVGDAAAVVFARELYGALAVGYPVDAAVSEARRILYVQGYKDDWATVALYTRADDGQLFTLPSQVLQALAAQWTTGDDVPCPFPGLEPFDEKMAPYFFGRETETAEAMAVLGGASPHR